ncbi:hypothetical protein [Paenirhodobacter hankyongi]|uniref:Sulfotransferase family protein n=1 Tax=Paenirhodobacter hankyongi TaxID=2294033 RepID=A0A421BSM2_9RHOB|nr:hypothetical protein [Sinirhodobacter hankyongi]RLL71301.1 hypothetical protein DYS74_05320 [Sinirhodobacter hankyongi]
MKLVCHIGTPKTGSTYLQGTFQQNRDWFLERGIIYPDLLSPLANHITLFYAAATYLDPSAVAYGLHSMEEVAAFRARLVEHIRAQIDAAPPHAHTMLFSSENLTGNLGRHDVLNLAEMLRPLFDEVEIVIYLRRQDDAVLSMYGEFMRRGYNNQTFDAFLQGATARPAVPHFLQYRVLLEFWLEAFGKDAIRVLLFDRAQMVGGDVLTDFLTRIFDITDTAGLALPAEDNRSLSAPAQEFLRRIQPFVPFYQGNSINPARQLLEARINQLPDRPRPYMSRAQSERVLERYRQGNEWVRQTFLPHHPAPLFPARPELGETSNIGVISLQDFAYLSAFMLTEGKVAAVAPAPNVEA